jgi:hypothetical protein
MPTLSRVAVTSAIALAVASPAAAQSEAALKSFFEGQRVVVRIDMPGTSDGVNVYADARRSMDLSEYREGLKKYGTAVRAGQSAMVTLVKVKKDLIEFQLDGGGYGTFGDDTSTSVYMPFVQKSEREKELERKVRDEDDRETRHRMERELDELRERRERENRRIQIEKERAEERKAERIAERRLTGGSRFNLRYEDQVPAGMRPEDMIAALAEYVDFLGLDRVARERTSLDRGVRPQPDQADQPESAADITLLRKGLTRSETERMFGRPAETSQKTTGDVTMTTLVFIVNGQRVSADFVEDVLVRYTITSK